MVAELESMAVKLLVGMRSPWPWGRGRLSPDDFLETMRGIDGESGDRGKREMRLPA
jgi:hypothetical protein